MSIQSTIEQINRMHGDQREQARRHAEFMRFLRLKLAQDRVDFGQPQEQKQ